MPESQLNNSESLKDDGDRPWIQSIHVNKIRHLENIDICISDDAAPRHLMVTGPNGSGKTSLMLAMKKLLEKMSNDKDFIGVEQKKWREMYENNLAKAKAGGDSIEIAKAEAGLDEQIKRIQEWFGELELTLHDVAAFARHINERKFIIAYYSDFREAKFKEVNTPDKPTFTYGISQNNGEQFVKFLVNLKIQQALAKNEGKISDAEEIEKWFVAFTGILRRIFSDDSLNLDFNYRDYSFEIVTNGTHFPFTGLSAGYAAVLDIVADLILRMQSLNRVTRVFDMPGIALIDEVETHLHLSLQQDIMPILTTVFPKVQFIVSTHSPFVLNSISNATIYDLKNRKCVQDLTEYSYEALAEGYFGVETDSGELKI